MKRQQNDTSMEPASPQTGRQHNTLRKQTSSHLKFL